MRRRKNILDIGEIIDFLHINPYLNKLNECTCQISQHSKLENYLEKKLKLFNLYKQGSRNVYLGLIYQSIIKLLIVYNMNGKFIDMSCRIQNFNSNNTNIRALCNHMGRENEVKFISYIYKISSTGQDAYN